MRDYWLNDMVFVTGDKKYALTETCRTICTGAVDEEKAADVLPPLPEPVTKPVKVSMDTPKPVVTDNSRKCEVCNNPFTSKRTDARYCSDKCRQIASRKNRQLVLIK